MNKGAKFYIVVLALIGGIFAIAFYTVPDKATPVEGVGIERRDTANPNREIVRYYDSLNRAVDSFEKSPKGILEAKKRRELRLKDSVLASKRQKRIIAISEKFNCKFEEAERLLNHEVWIGMKYDMLVYLRGKPNKINVSNYGNGNRYQAVWFNYTPSYFYFEEDEIIKAYN